MTAYYNEIDPKAAAWLRELIKRGLIAQGEVDERSILEVRPDDLSGFSQCHFFAGIGVWSYALRRAGWADDRPVWTGSCPCQPFSAAGKGDEFADERHLWPAWFRLIRERRPVAVFGEQVASKDALSWLDHVSTDLEAEGYAVGAVDTCAAGFGAPHIRQRLYFVAEQGGASPRQRAEQSAARSIISVVDAEHAERWPVSGHREDERERNDSGRPEAHGIVGACSEVRRVADATNPRRPGAREHDGGQPQLSARPVEHGCVGNPSRRGLGIERDAAQQGSGGHADGAGELVAIARLGTGDDRRTRIEFVEHAKQQGLEGHAGHGHDRDGSGRIGADAARPATEAGSVSFALGNAEINGRERRPIRDNGEQADGIAQAGIPGHAMEHANGRGPQIGWADHDAEVGGSLPNGSSATDLGPEAAKSGPGPTNGFWSNAEWIACRDGKARPTEPGTFPLVTGAPARVVRLRGYGNAINAEQARNFIEAYQEVSAA